MAATQDGWTVGTVAQATPSPSSDKPMNVPSSWTVGKPPTVQPAASASAPARARWGDYAKLGPYKTELKPEEEAKFKSWVKDNKIPFENDSPTSDYDMRGFWKAQQSGDPSAKRAENLHFPDTYKTPYHETFSKESKYALSTAGHWDGDKFIAPGAKASQPPQSAPPAKPPSEPWRKTPFSSGTISGMGFDPEKLKQAGQFEFGKKIMPRQHPWVNEGAEVVKQAAKGMGEWMDATVRDPGHIVDPLDSMARVLEFHVPKPGGGNWDPFDLHKAGIEHTALDEIGSGIKHSDTAKLEHGAGRLLGGLSTIFAAIESPEAVKGLAKLPQTVSNVVSDVTTAKNKPVIIAAANNVLEHDTKNVVIPTIVQGVKSTQEAIGRRVKTIADADRTASVAAGKAGSVTRIELADAIKQAVLDKNASSVPKPGLQKAIKALGRYKNDMSWEDLKDYRAAVYGALREARGKDSAILGQLIEDSTNRLAARAKQVGQATNWDEYNDMTRRLNDHKQGIVKTLSNASTGLKLYNELAKASNKPQLNDLFGLLEQHGGVPSGFIDNLVKTRKPIHALAKLSDSGESSGGRMGAVLRHPLAAGTAMVGTGMGLTLSPMPLSGSFVASLIAAQKVASFMDRYDAAKAIREQALGGRSKPLRGNQTPFATSASAQAPSGGATPTGGVVPLPTVPKAPPSGPASPAVAPPSTGVPLAPASIDDFMSRVSDAQKRQQVAREATPVETPTAKAPAAKTAEPKPYEAFGVKIDKEKLTTPEAVKAAKEDGKAQLQEIAREKYKNEILKMPAGAERTAATKQLDKDIINVSRSIDKLQTPDVSRKARDRVRKAADTSQEKPSEAVENLSPEQVAQQRGAAQVTDSEAAMMEGIDLQMEAARMGPRVLGVYNKVLEQAGGDSQAALPQLRALMEQVRKAKK